MSLKRPKWFVFFDENYGFDSEEKAKVQTEKMKHYIKRLMLFYMFLISFNLCYFRKEMLLISLVIFLISPFLMDYFIKKNKDSEWFSRYPTLFYPLLVFSDFDGVSTYMMGLRHQEDFLAFKKENFKDLKKIDLQYALEYCNDTKNEKDFEIYRDLKDIYNKHSEENRLNSFNKKIDKEEKSIGVKLRNKISLKIENN